MYKQLTREQRYAIYLGLQRGATYTSIAQEIGCSISTVSREIKRNTNRHGHYLWQQAQENTQWRKERSCKNRKLKQYIVDEAIDLLINNQWSPAQISGWFKNEKNISISHESIYRIIRADETGCLKTHTRHKMKYRHHNKVHKKTKATNIPNRVSIHDRPKEADGSRFGDWEMDLVVGKGQKSALLTLVERKTNYLLMCYVPNKHPDVVAKAACNLLCGFIGFPIKTITTDNGVEFAHHQIIAKFLRTKVYFADSYSSWQKGAIENTNKLIRQYFPKGTDFNLVTKEQILEVQYKINARPRKKLNFKTPVMAFYNYFL